MPLRSCFAPAQAPGALAARRAVAWLVQEAGDAEHRRDVALLELGRYRGWIEEEEEALVRRALADLDTENPHLREDPL